MRWTLLPQGEPGRQATRRLPSWLWAPTFFVVLGLSCWFMSSCSSGPTRASHDSSHAAWTPIEGAAYVGEDTCAGCHDKQAKEFQHTVHGQAFVKVEGEETHVSCENCHGPGSKHAENGGDPRFILKGDVNNCEQCHREKKAEFALNYHHPVPEGRMKCADCHTVHATAGAAKTSLNENDKCLSCHKQYRGPWTFEHEAMRDGCVTCHKPHGSMNNKLLTEPEGQLCLKCHYNEFTYQSIGQYRHRAGGNPVPNNCVNCHSGIHGSNFNKSFRSE